VPQPSEMHDVTDNETAAIDQDSIRSDALQHNLRAAMKQSDEEQSLAAPVDVLLGNGNAVSENAKMSVEEQSMAPNSSCDAAEAPTNLNAAPDEESTRPSNDQRIGLVASTQSGEEQSAVSNALCDAAEAPTDLNAGSDEEPIRPVEDQKIGRVASKQSSEEQSEAPIASCNAAEALTNLIAKPDEEPTRPGEEPGIDRIASKQTGEEESAAPNASCDAAEAPTILNAGSDEEPARPGEYKVNGRRSSKQTGEEESAAPNASCDAAEAPTIFNAEPTRFGGHQKIGRGASKPTGEEQGAAPNASLHDVAVLDVAPARATMSFAEVRKYRPNYFLSVPASFVDVYNEYKGVGQYLNQPVVGGIEKLADMRVQKNGRKWKSNTAPDARYFYTGVVTIAQQAESQIETVTDAETNKSILQVLQEWDALLAASGATFWDFYEQSIKPQVSVGDVYLPKQQTHTGSSNHETIQARR
jgi:hypothetical protein